MAKSKTSVAVVKENKVGIREYNANKIEDVTKMAVALKEYVVRQGLFTNIKGKNYAQVEGWQVAGGMLGLKPKVASVQNLSTGSEIKWMATVELIDKNGVVVGNGFAVCSSKESSKKSFDEYAILSMAQTRAIGKAYRNHIGWVMKLAGYQGTPAEEMRKVSDPEPEVTTVHYEQAEDGKYYSESGQPITKAVYDYSMKMYGMPLSREDMTSGKYKPKLKIK